MRKVAVTIKANPGLGACCIIALVLPFVLSISFYQHLLIMILLWATMGVAWNMLAGFAGQFSLGHALFFGAGAYTTTLLFTKAGIVPWLGTITGVIFAVTIAFVLGFPLFRLSGFYFSIGTIALGEIAWILFTNWNWVGGARGLFVPIKGNTLLYMQFTYKMPYYYIILSFFVLTMIASYILAKSKAGYYFKAIRDETEAAISLGVDIMKYKTIAYVFSAAFTALAGAFYANYILYIDPDSVMMGKLSIQIVLVTVLGGIGHLWGPLVGALVLVPISEFSRVYLSGGGRALDLVFYGVLMVILAVFQPTGLVGLYNKLKDKNRRRKQISRKRQEIRS